MRWAWSGVSIAQTILCIGSSICDILKNASRIAGEFVDPLSINVIRYVKDVSRILAYPFFSVAYFLQSSGPVWHFSLAPISPFDMHRSNPLLPAFLTMLFIKVAIASTVLFIVITVFNAVLKETGDDGSGCVISSVIFMIWTLRLTLLAFALIGIFLRAHYPTIGNINTFWFVGCLVFGLSLTPETAVDAHKKT
jgi:hypothetical protein